MANGPEKNESQHDPADSSLPVVQHRDINKPIAADQDKLLQPALESQISTSKKDHAASNSEKVPPGFPDINVKWDVRKQDEQPTKASNLHGAEHKPDSKVVELQTHHRIILEQYEIKDLLTDVLKSSDNPIIKYAIKSGAIDFNDDFFTQDDGFCIHPRLLEGSNIKPSEMVSAVTSLLREVTGTEVNVDYRQHGEHEGLDLESPAAIAWTGNTEQLSARLAQSTHPVAQQFFAKIQAHEARKVEQAAAEAEALRRQELAQKQQPLQDEINARYKGSPFTKDSLNPKALAVVHATRYLPEILEDGSVAITTHSGATNNEIPRNTSHFALNHKVKDIAHFGNWSDAGITIIAPFDEMMRRNGAPALLMTVDSVWTSGLGKKLVIPDATVVVPGNVPADSLSPLYSLDLKRTTYKDQNFSVEDVRHLLKSLDSHKAENFKKSANNILAPLKLDLPYLLDASSGTAMLNECLPAGNESVRTEFEDLVRETINSLAINKTLEYRGYEVQHGGSYAWNTDDPNVKTKAEVFAAELGAIPKAHSNSIYGSLEGSASLIGRATMFMEDVIRSYSAPSQVEIDGFGAWYVRAPNGKDFETPKGDKLSIANYESLRSGDYLLPVITNKTTYVDPNTQEMITTFSGIAPNLRQVDTNTQEVYSDYLKKQRAKVEKIEAYFGRSPDNSPALQALDDLTHEIDASVARAMQPNGITQETPDQQSTVDTQTNGTQDKPSQQTGDKNPGVGENKPAEVKLADNLQPSAYEKTNVTQSKTSEAPSAQTVAKESWLSNSREFLNKHSGTITKGFHGAFSTLGIVGGAGYIKSGFEDFRQGNSGVGTAKIVTGGAGVYSGIGGLHSLIAKTPGAWAGKALSRGGTVFGIGAGAIDIYEGVRDRNKIQVADGTVYLGTGVIAAGATNPLVASGAAVFGTSYAITRGVSSIEIKGHSIDKGMTSAFNAIGVNHSANSEAANLAKTNKDALEATKDKSIEALKDQYGNANAAAKALSLSMNAKRDEAEAMREKGQDDSAARAEVARIKGLRDKLAQKS